MPKDGWPPVFPMNLIEQEMSTQRWIDIPEPVLEKLCSGGPRRCTARRRLEQRSAPRPDLLQERRASPRPAATSPTPPCPGLLQQAVRHQAPDHRDRRRPVGQRAGLRLQLFGLECKVYMVRISFDQKPFRKMMMQTWGAECIASPSTETQAGRDILARACPTPPAAWASPSARPSRIARDHRQTPLLPRQRAQPRLLHQTIIGLEAKKQLAKIGEYPDVVIGCAGGGSNFAGIGLPVRVRQDQRREVEIIAVEPAACPTHDPRAVRLRLRATPP
jgi:tryptophan synthase beta chain